MKTKTCYVMPEDTEVIVSGRATPNPQGLLFAQTTRTLPKGSVVEWHWDHDSVEGTMHHGMAKVTDDLGHTGPANVMWTVNKASP